MSARVSPLLLVLVGSLIVGFSACSRKQVSRHVQSFDDPVDSVYISRPEVITYKFSGPKRMEFTAVNHGICLVEVRLGERSEALVFCVDSDLRLSHEWIDMSSRVWIDFE